MNTSVWYASLERQSKRVCERVKGENKKKEDLKSVLAETRVIFFTFLPARVFSRIFSCLPVYKLCQQSRFPFAQTFRGMQRVYSKYTCAGRRARREARDRWIGRGVQRGDPRLGNRGTDITFFVPPAAAPHPRPPFYWWNCKTAEGYRRVYKTATCRVFLRLG